MGALNIVFIVVTSVVLSLDIDPNSSDPLYQVFWETRFDFVCYTTALSDIKSFGPAERFTPQRSGIDYHEQRSLGSFSPTQFNAFN